MQSQAADVSWDAAVRAYIGFYADPIHCIERLYARYGPVISLSNPWPGRDRGQSSLLLIGSEFNREVLQQKPHLFRPTGVWPVPGPQGSAQDNLRRNYLCMHGAEHDAYSNIFSEHVSRTRVDGLFEDVKRIANSQISGWPVDEPVDLLDLTRRLAHRYSFSLLFGEADLDRVSKFGRLVDQYHTANWSRAALFCRLDLPGFAYRRVLRHAEALQSFILEWAEERRGCPHDRDLRAAFVNGRKADSTPIAPPEYAANLSGLAMASYETSAITLAWALFLLAHHPKVMGRLLDELAAQPPIDKIELKTLKELPLLDAVIQETLRLITPVPLLGFRMVKNGTLAGHERERDTLVIISPHMTHRLPDIYQAADRFRPERWFTIRPSAYEYLPFSAGQRRCPGYWFAINNLKVALATILPRYRVAIEPGARVDRAYCATTVPSPGIPVRLEPQDGALTKAKCTGTVFDLFTPDE